MTSPPFMELNPMSPVGSPTTTGYEKRILEANPHLSKGVVKKLAAKVADRAKSMQAEFDFYESLRILGISPDPTARDGEHRATCRRAECDKCGRTARRAA